MKLIIIGNVRRDGKQKVRIFFPGGPNMFGGNYPGKDFNKLVGPEKLAELKEQANDGVSHE